MDRTLGVVFFGTPHRGRDSSGLFKLVHYAKQKGQISAESLDEKCLISSLKRIQRKFEELCSKKVLQIKVVSFYEELEVPGFGLVISSPPGTKELDLNVLAGCGQTSSVCEQLHGSSFTRESRGILSVTDQAFHKDVTC